MSEEKNLAEREGELWQEVSSTQGADRARAYKELAWLRYEKEDFTDSLAFCEIARELFLSDKEYKDSDELIYVYIGQYRNLMELGRHRDAAETAHELAIFYGKLNDDRIVCALRDEGHAWYAAEEYEKSLAVFLEASNTINPDIDTFDYGLDQFNIGISANRLNRFDEARTHLLSALEIFKAEKNPEMASHCHNELSLLNLNIENAVELEHWAQKLLDYAELAGNFSLQHVAHFRLGVAARLVDDLEKACDELATAHRILLGLDRMDWRAMVKVEKERAGIEIIKGNVGTADEILRRISTIEETLGD